jgi:hypothetical protein
MNKTLRYFDLFKKPITLPIESENFYSSYSGFITSILTFLAFALHFYFEAYEVFVRKHPNIYSMKNNIHYSYEPKLVISNETLKLFINIQTSYKIRDGDFLDYLSSHHVYTLTNDKIGTVEFRNCTEHDFSRFKEVDKSFQIPKGINLCPSINFSFRAYSSEDFSLSFSLRECRMFSKVCKRDKDLYNYLSKFPYFIYSQLYIVSAQEEMRNYTKPYSFNIKRMGFNIVDQAVKIELEGSEIKTDSLFDSFTQTNLKYIYSTNDQVHNDGRSGIRELIGFRLVFKSSDITIYNRTYKTLSTAFSNAYSLFKLYSWLFEIILGEYYSYNINNIIINKNIDYVASLDNNIKQDTMVKSNEDTIDLKNALNDYTTKTLKKESLTISLICRKVSCCRYLCCTRRNATQAFYDKSTTIIKKYLSIEHLVMYFIDSGRLKNFLFDKHLELTELNFNERLILNFKNNKDKEKVSSHDSVFENLNEKDKNQYIS